jgi:hypothetical protein
MRFARGLVLPVVVVGLIAFGATYDVPRPPEPRLAAGELTWLASFRDWAAAPLAERCGRELATAPTDRLGDIRDDLLGACRELEPRERLTRSREARGELTSLLVDRRPLPVSGELVGSSRIEPTLGAALTALAGGRPVEVRCWSQADWRIVRAEEAALTGTQAGLPAFWLPSTRTLNLQGVDCGPLVLLARGLEPRARARRADLALALWVVTAAAEAASARPCVAPATLATALGASGRYAVGLATWARAELGPLLPPPSRRCRTSRPS